MKKAKVSLCIIAYNEENCIQTCITSVGHLVDEIIVVDTGSSDQTPAIAAGLGAKVFAWHWQGNFAAARNFALDQADGEWILVLDCDEVLQPVPDNYFKQLITADGVLGYNIHIVSYLGNGEAVTDDYVVRLFKNRADIRFQGVIHEQVAGCIQGLAGSEGLRFCDLTIKHYGYTDTVITAKGKRQRNMCIIKEAMARLGPDPFLLYNLGLEFLQAGNLDRGIDNLLTALHCAAGTEAYLADLIVTLGFALLAAKRNEIDYGTILAKALTAYPGNADLMALQGLFYLREDKCGPALEILLQALKNKGRFAANWRVRLWLGDVLLQMGEQQKAWSQYFSSIFGLPGLDLHISEGRNDEVLTEARYVLHELLGELAVRQQTELVLMVRLLLVAERIDNRREIKELCRQIAVEAGEGLQLQPENHLFQYVRYSAEMFLLVILLAEKNPFADSALLKNSIFETLSLSYKLIADGIVRENNESFSWESG